MILIIFSRQLRPHSFYIKNASASYSTQKEFLWFPEVLTSWYNHQIYKTLLTKINLKNQ